MKIPLPEVKKGIGFRVVCSKVWKLSRLRSEMDPEKHLREAKGLYQKALEEFQRAKPKKDGMLLRDASRLNRASKRGGGCHGTTKN
ncbi:MAG: hypothetical protein ACE5OR_08515 [bacterium]